MGVDKKDLFVTNSVSFGLRPPGEFSFTLTAPFRYNEGEYSTSNTMEVELYGLSDLSVEATWTPSALGWRMGSVAVEPAFVLGLKLGTGEYDRTDDNDDLVPTRYQLGTGTTCPSFGVKTGLSFSSGPKAWLSLTYQVNSENGVGYERGDSLTAVVGFGWTVLDWLHLSPGLSVIAVLQHDRQDGVIVEDSRDEFPYAELAAKMKVSTRFLLTVYVRCLLSAGGSSSENAQRQQMGAGFSVHF